jgi:hypothetical protein
MRVTRQNICKTGTRRGVRWSSYGRNHPGWLLHLDVDSGAVLHLPAARHCGRQCLPLGIGLPLALLAAGHLCCLFGEASAPSPGPYLVLRDNVDDHLCLACNGRLNWETERQVEPRVRALCASKRCGMAVCITFCAPLETGTHSCATHARCRTQASESPGRLQPGSPEHHHGAGRDVAVGRLLHDCPYPLSFRKRCLKGCDARCDDAGPCWRNESDGYRIKLPSMEDLSCA